MYLYTVQYIYTVYNMCISPGPHHRSGTRQAGSRVHWRRVRRRQKRGVVVVPVAINMDKVLI